MSAVELQAFREWLVSQAEERERAAKVHGRGWSDFAKIYRAVLAEFDRRGFARGGE